MVRRAIRRELSGPAGRRLALLLLLLLALALRLYRLGDASIWWDEGWSVWLARQPVAEILRQSALDVHPPLYHLLLGGWLRLTGESEFAVRALSALLGTLVIAAAWDVARLLLPRRPWLALGATTLLALSRFSIWWAQESRMYTLGALLATLSLGMLIRLRRTPRRGAAVGYLLATTGALLTLYLLVLLPLIHGLYWLLTLPRGAGRALASLGRWLGLQVLIVLAVLPWLLYMLPRLRSWSSAVTFEPRLFLELYLTLLALGISTGVEGYRWLTLPLAGLTLLGAGLLVAHRRSRRGALLLLLVLALPPLLIWSVTMLPRSFGYTPRPEARYLLPYAPLYPLLLLWAGTALLGLLGRAGTRLLPLYFAALLAVSLWTLPPYYAARLRADDYVSAAATVRAHRQPGDRVLLHTDHAWPLWAFHLREQVTGTPHLEPTTPAAVDFLLEPLWQGSEGLWLVINEDASARDPDRLYEGWLRARALRERLWSTGDSRVILFARTPARAAALDALAPAHPLPAPPPTAPDGVVGWETALRRARAGETLHAAAYVRQGEHARRLVVALEPGGAVQEATVPPGSGVVRLPLALQVPAGSPAGRLRWEIGLDGRSGHATTVAIVPRGPSRSTLSGREPSTPLDVSYGEPAALRLRGYDLTGEFRPGGRLELTLYWETVRSPDRRYKIFAHLLTGEPRVVAQQDAFPLGGEPPTQQWRPGEQYDDRLVIELSSDLPPGTYQLVSGFYDPVDGTRLAPAREAGGPPLPLDQAWLAEVEVTAEE